MFGKSITLSTAAFGGASRNRVYLCMPSLNSSVPLPTSPTPLPQHMEWPHPNTWPIPKTPPTVTAYAPLRYQKAKEWRASGEESKMAREARYVHHPSGTTRIPDICDTATLLQMPRQIVESLQMYSTCDEVIWATTYIAVQQQYRPPIPSLKTIINNPTTPLPLNMFRCGEEILCCKCSEVVQLLGKCWHYRKALAVLTHLLTHEPATLSTAFPAFNNRPHACKASCPKLLYPSKKRKSLGDPPRSAQTVKGST